MSVSALRETTQQNPRNATKIDRHAPVVGVAYWHLVCLDNWESHLLNDLVVKDIFRGFYKFDLALSSIIFVNTRSIWLKIRLSMMIRDPSLTCRALHSTHSREKPARLKNSCKN